MSRQEITLMEKKQGKESCSRAIIKNRNIYSLVKYTLVSLFFFFFLILPHTIHHSHCHGAQIHSRGRNVT